MEEMHIKPLSVLTEGIAAGSAQGAAASVASGSRNFGV